VGRIKVGAMVLAVAAGILVYMSAPPGRQILRGAPDDSTVPGVMHVHTNRSDGRSSPDEIAERAARAGLKFVIFTDHGDGTRPPDPPAYRSGVLTMDGVEISTTAGHYIALDMRESPYPLGGEPRDVVEDVRRLGGFGIAAHPDSPKRELSWSQWDLPIDGLEIVNPDTAWRVHVGQPGLQPKLHLLRALATYPFVPEETIASLLNDPSSIITRWQSLIASRPVVAVAGVDAHAKLALWDVEPGDNRFTLPFPGYASAFRTLSTHVRPDAPFTGNAAADAAALMRGIRAGHLYTAIDAFATPPSFEFSASNDESSVYQGSTISSAEPIRLHVRSNAPSEYTATVLEGDRVLSTGRGDFTVLAPSGPAVYRVEIRAASRPGQPLWIASNPIYVGLARLARPMPQAQGAAAVIPDPARTLFPATPWSVEHDARSRADLHLEEGAMRLAFALDADAAARPRVAIAAPPLAIVPNDHVAFTMRADRPMRVSIQLRSGADGSREERWQRSVYVDTHDREIAVPFDAMTPVGTTATAQPRLDATPSVVLVIDTTHARAGASGQLWIARAAFARSAPKSASGPFGVRP
jgi:hypothetical protein